MAKQTGFLFGSLCKFTVNSTLMTQAGWSYNKTSFKRYRYFHYKEEMVAEHAISHYLNQLLVACIFCGHHPREYFVDISFFFNFDWMWSLWTNLYQLSIGFGGSVHWTHDNKDADVRRWPCGSQLRNSPTISAPICLPKIDISMHDILHSTTGNVHFITQGKFIVVPWQNCYPKRE